MRVDCPQMLVVLLAAIGCAGHGAGPDASSGPGDGALPSDGPIHPSGVPSLGAHSLKYYKYMSDLPKTLSTASLSTQPTGSTILVNIGRGDNTKFVLPTDTKGNIPYRQMDEMHPYDPYFQDSGTALYAFRDAKGGANFQVSTVTRTDSTMDEITLVAVEVVNATSAPIVRWNQPTGSPLKSESVTTTGPATLVAFWWGNGFPGTPQSATPNNEFVPIETNAADTDSFVQCAVAAKTVSAAGTYDVTWTADPEQGAQLWLVAVQ